MIVFVSFVEFVICSRRCFCVIKVFLEVDLGAFLSLVLLLFEMIHNEVKVLFVL